MYRRLLIFGFAVLGLTLPSVALSSPAFASPSPVADNSAEVDGIVYASVQAGDRTIIGGQFTTAGGLPRANVAAIRADGTVDPTWNPSISGTVYAIEVSDDGSKIYIGGIFTTVGGVARANLVAVNPTTGAMITSWKTKTSSAVRGLAASSGRLYVGGSFARIGNTDVNRLAAVSQTTGIVDTTFAPRPSATVRAVDVSPNGQKVYAGGAFTTIAGAGRPGIAELNAAGGSLTGFAPTDGGVIIALDPTPDGNRVFFSSTSNRTYAYDPAVSNSPAYRVRTGGDVQAIAATADEVYVGGHFTNFPEAKVSRPTLASFRTSDGTVTAWNPTTGNWNFGVWTITATPDFVAIGGDFTRVGGVRHQGFARFPVAP